VGVTLSDAVCPRWIFANAGARGYYRTEYPPALLRAMAPDVQTQLTAPERLSLIDDEWAMVRGRRHTIADYLTLAGGYGREHANGVLADVTNRFAFIHTYLATEATRPRFAEFVRQLFRPLYAELGFTPAATDGDDRRALRATVVDALGTMASDPEVVSQARAALDRALSGQTPLDPTLAQSVVLVAVEHGDAKLFDALAAAMARATSPEEQYRYLFALGDFRDPALIDRALPLVLTPQIRSQDAALYLGGFFENPAARDRAWSFLVAHWTEVAPKITISGGDVRIVSAAGAFCDARSRDAIAAFFAAHPLPGAARTLEQTVDRINNCIALGETQTAVLAEWLAGR
jgi:aminopeptidase N